jgi:predicted nucleic acid-binding Zn ribbon protein
MNKPKCVVCGARSPWGQKTCDVLCARAQKYGRDRGKQMELEVRDAWRRPIVVDSLTKPDRSADLEYNRPYMMEVY